MDTLRARLATAPATTNPTFDFAYGDDNGNPVLGQSSGALTGTTTKTLVGSPGSSVQRAINSGTIYNADSADVIVTVEKFDGTNARTITTTKLASGYTLQLTPYGWRVIDKNGVQPMPQPADASAFGPQDANTFLAGPETGTSAIAAFRTLKTPDLSGVVLDGGNF
jgi:hypothetical protein